MESITTLREVSLFRNGANQALRIPREMELASKRVSIQQMPDGLYIRAVPDTPQTLQALLATWEPCDFDWPDVDEGLLPLDNIVL